MWGCIISPTIGPGRTITTWTTRSYRPFTRQLATIFGRQALKETESRLVPADLRAHDLQRALTGLSPYPSGPFNEKLGQIV